MRSAVLPTAELVLEGIGSNWEYSEVAQRAGAQIEASTNDQRGWVRAAAAAVMPKLHASDSGVQAAG
jgi:hypothetical protein